MTVMSGLCYALYFSILGYAARASYNLFNQTQLLVEKKTDFFAHSFFLGVFIHVVVFKLYQLLNLSNSNTLILTTIIFICCLCLITWHTLKFGIQSDRIKPSVQNTVLISITALGSSAIYWNSSNLPNMAWDSWMVWVGKADQWIIHGLSVQINEFEMWLRDSESIFNSAAHYPDGLSLIYFLPKLLAANNGTTNVLYLFAFAMTALLLASRLGRKGAPFYLQLLFIVVMFTTPLINNHLMIQGYADIWMAMYIVLIMLTFMDYHEKHELGVGITLVGYLLMLPLLKIEGWVWLALFIIAHLFVAIANHRHRLRIISVSLMLLALIILLGGINLEFPLGNLIVVADKIEIFGLLNTQIKFTNINDHLLSGFFWQNNWSIIWVGLPFLLLSIFTSKHNKASQISHVFFILALTCFMFLFYFTDASKWAEDLTALNRIVLQLTLCYLFLLFRLLTTLKNVQQASE